MTDHPTRRVVTLRTTLTLLTAVAASLALAIPPAVAQDAGQDNRADQGADQDGQDGQDGQGADQDGQDGQDGQGADQDGQDGQGADQGADQDGQDGQDGQGADQDRQDADQGGQGADQDQRAGQDQADDRAGQDAAENGQEPRGNPVEHCLPEQARGGPGGPPETGTARTPNETETAGTPETGTARSEVAQCVLESLPDIVGNAHAASIVSVVSERVAQGYPDGSFRPQNAVNRAQMGTFLTRALNLEAPEGGPDAPDVDAEHPHAEGIAAVLEAGIALGKADGSFAPGEPVSRGQMAAFLTRALDLGEEEADVPEDADDSVHEESIRSVTGAGIAAGFPDGSFRPADAVTRAQMATFLARGLGLESA